MTQSFHLLEPRHNTVPTRNALGRQAKSYLLPFVSPRRLDLLVVLSLSASIAKHELATEPTRDRDQNHADQ